MDHSDGNNDNLHFIKIGGNFLGQITDNINLPDELGGLKDFKSNIVGLELDKDYILEYELQRIKNRQELEGRRKNEGVVSPNGSKAVLENDTRNLEWYLSGFYLFYLDKSKPDVEIRTSHFSQGFHWLSDRYIAYDVFRCGVYVYDIVEKMEIPIAEGRDVYINIVENNKIKYYGINEVNGEDFKAYKEYEFDKSGNLILK